MYKDRKDGGGRWESWRTRGKITGVYDKGERQTEELNLVRESDDPHRWKGSWFYIGDLGKRGGGEPQLNGQFPERILGRRGTSRVK